jgi:Dolichyl-phosphate-mannose--protein O-mannosyl transferase
MIDEFDAFSNIKNSKLINCIYIAISIILLFLSLKVYWHYTSGSFYTTSEINNSFFVLLIFTVIFLILALLIGRLGMHLVIRVILVLGISLRICYTMFTDVGTRTYDVFRESWGHLDYIKYIAQNYSLPPVNECQAYHPPVHHIIAALAMNLGKLFIQKELLQLKLIQMVMVILSSLTLVIFYRILKELKCNNTALLIGLSIFAFHPMNIYFSSRINNDNTLLFFYTLSFYLLIKWINNDTTANILILALAAALAALTKFSGFMLVPVIGLAFITALFSNRCKIKHYLRQYFIFGLFYVPLSLSYYIRNYILFNQNFGYVPSLGQGFIPTFYNLIYIPVKEMLQNPFNNGGLNGGEFFMEYFIKSSLYGEWQFPGLGSIATVMIILAVLIAFSALLYIMFTFRKGKGYIKYILILNLFLPIIMEMKFRTDFPIACSQDFRYAAPLLISAAFFIGDAIVFLRNSRFKSLGHSISACVVAFCILSTVFVLLLGYYK